MQKPTSHPPSAIRNCLFTLGYACQVNVILTVVPLKTVYSEDTVAVKLSCPNWIPSQ